jgi:agmatine/peptidylarginine deiminase
MHDVLQKEGVCHALLEDTADIWCRDYMPIQTSTNEMVAYIYRPDYLSTPKMQKYITDTDLMVEHIQEEYAGVDIKRLDLVIDGGNVVKCGDTIVMTEKVFNENPDWPEFMVLDKLEEAFGCEVLLLPWDRTEEYGHSDGIIHYVGDNRVLLTNYDDFSPAYFRRFRNQLERKFEVIPLSYPVKNKSEHNWAYINYLQVGNLMMVPQMGIPEDEMAIEQIQSIVPETMHVVGIPAMEAVRNGGALNCVSWNIDASIIQDSATIINFVSPLQYGAFTEEVIYKMLQQRLDFQLPEELWHDINEAFSYYWDIEIGLGNLFDLYAFEEVQVVIPNI